jgi:hypothetical protein
MMNDLPPDGSATSHLRWFGLLFAVFNVAVATIFVRPFNVGWSIYLSWAAVVILLVTCYYSLPRYQHDIYRIWNWLVSPIAWLITHVLLLTIFCVCLVPVGCVMRLVGYDPLHRKIDRQRSSYWMDRNPRGKLKEYFRQY